MEQKKVPRIMIAGTNSGSGKTTVVCGILAALKRRGLKAASLKCGPDYIDPMFHSQIFGIPSKNLDLYFTNAAMAQYLMAENAKDAFVTVMEGVMGFYDGMEMSSSAASSYDLARQTKTPVILIVNAKGMALSVQAIIKGFMDFREDHTIQGVILNGVTKMTGKMMTEQIEANLGIKVYGTIPYMKDNTLASRHLGLVTPFELETIEQEIERLGEIVEENVLLDELLALAEQAEPVCAKRPENVEKLIQTARGQFIREDRKLRVAVGFDKAFCFYYKDNLEVLEEMGCELIFFSPLTDKQLPKHIDGILLGGGYPEVYAKELSQNDSMRKSVKEAADNGIPIMAECGGFMYLHKELEDEAGTFYPMTGVINGKAANQKKLVRFGYISLKANQKNDYLDSDETIKAHEFHYWDSDQNGSAFLAVKPSGKRSWNCMHAVETILAGYPHLYYYSNLNVPYRFLKKCQEYRFRKERELCSI